MKQDKDFEDYIILKFTGDWRNLTNEDYEELMEFECVEDDVVVGPTKWVTISSIYKVGNRYFGITYRKNPNDNALCDFEFDGEFECIEKVETVKHYYIIDPEEEEWA